MSTGETLCPYCGIWWSLHSEAGMETCRLMAQWGVPIKVVRETYGCVMGANENSSLLHAIVQLEKRVAELEAKIDRVRIGQSKRVEDWRGDY